MYDPDTDAWTTLASASQKRLYHSGALLLETGHVVTIGSEMDNYDDLYGSNNAALQQTCMPTFSTQLGSAVPNPCRSPFNTNIERFTPPYLQGQPGPAISNAPLTLTHGSVFQVDLSTPANNVGRVTFTRMTSTTHSTNTDQRFVELVILAYTGSSLFVQMPVTPNQAIIGNWFLWVLDKNGVPSTAKTINLQLGPATNVAIPAGATIGSHSGVSRRRWYTAVLMGLISVFIL